MRPLMNNLLQFLVLILIMMETSVLDNKVDLAIWRIDPNLSCCDALSQIPSIITPLGHLLLFSAEKDFSLCERRDNRKFEYIKNPDSFRSCVAQVSEDIWQSFHSVHNSMKQIRIKSNNIASDEKKAAEIIKKGSKDERSLARVYLQNTGKMRTECVETAASITKEFKDVASEMNELLKACQVSKGRCEDEQQKIIHRTEANWKEQEQGKEKEKQLIEKREQKKEFEAMRNCDEKCHYPSQSPNIEPFRVICGLQVLERPTIGAEIHTALGKGLLLEDERRYQLSHDEEPKEKIIVVDDHEEPQSSLDELDRIQHTLEDSIIALGQIIKHWTIIQEMLQLFHDTLKKYHKEDGKHFCNITVSEPHRDRQKHAEITTQTLTKEFKEAQQITHEVKSITSLHVTVLKTYILDGLIRLQRIVLLDPSRDRKRMEEIKKELEEEQKRARNGILAITQEKRRKLRERLQEINSSSGEASLTI